MKNTTYYLTNDQIAHIMALPLLSKSLPYVFQNGSVLGGIAFACTSCGAEFAEENIKGEIVPTNTHAAMLSSYGLCYDCRLAQPCSCRLADDGTFLVQGPDGWIKKRYAPEPTASLLNRIKSYLLTGGLK